MNIQFSTPASSLITGKNLHDLNQAGSYSGKNSINESIQNTIQLLEKELVKGMPGFTPIAQLDATDFAPQSVADRILGFVESSINQRSNSDLEAQSMLQQAREGIVQGFAEAREILSVMPQMNNETNRQINETEELIFKGLDDLYSTPKDTAQQQKIGKLISESASQSSQFKQSNQAGIEIITQDGDKVEVSYSAFIQAASNQSYTQQQQGYSASSEQTSASTASFEFNVQGDIDTGEQQAINKLLNKVGDLAQQFFNGDVQSAFNAAMELGFDSNELKSFALDFKQSSSLEVVQTYQRTEKINQTVEPQDIKFKKINNGPGPAVNVLAQLENLLEEAKVNALIAQPEQTIKSVLKDMMGLLGQEMELPVNKYIKQSIE